MEKLKPIHKHDLTNIIKVGMFALMLLLPFLVFLPNAFYYGFNEHATNETTTEVDIQYKYQSNEVNSLDDLVLGNIYYIDYLKITSQDESAFDDTPFAFNLVQCHYINTQTINNYVDDLYVEDYDSKNNNLIQITFEDSYYFYILMSNYNGYISYAYENYQYIEIDKFVFIYNDTYFKDYLSFANILPIYSDYNVIESVDVQTDVEQTITQQMYNSWQTMWQTPLFSWTSNSLLNTGLTAFTSGLGIDATSYIANFLTYELVIVAIYIVLDIVLTLFTWLTHIGQKE